MSDQTPDGTAYEDIGPRNAPVLVFIHGLGLCRDIWQPHLAAFNGYRTVTYDLYGHGDSAAAPAMASLSVYADQIAQLLQHLGIARASLIGFSIGGMINRRFALDHPQMLDRLVILNSPHDRGDDAQQAVEARALTVRTQGAMSTMGSALKRWFTPDCLEQAKSPAPTTAPAQPAPAQPTTTDGGPKTDFKAGSAPAQVISWRNKVDPESYAQAAWVLAHGVRELTGLEGTITQPALVMTCENDTGSTPQMSFDIASEIPSAQVEIVPVLQHLGLMENPSAFTLPILDFLGDTQ